jgi:holo-[acyl-carrier protein] synthase
VPRLDDALAALLRCGQQRVAGIGMDIEAVAAFDDAADSADSHFYRRLFTAREIAYCLGRPSPAQHFAARFAAKEAVVKACRGRVPLLPCDIEISRDGTGAPSAEVPRALGLLRFEVSLGHCADVGYAVAVAFEAGRDS